MLGRSNEWGRPELTRKMMAVTPGYPSFKSFTAGMKIDNDEIKKRIRRVLGRIPPGEVERQTDPTTAETP